MNAVSERRLGKFSIPMQVITDDPVTAVLCLEGCIVVRAEAMYFNGTIEYTAFHDDFLPVPVQDIPNEYVGQISPGRREWKQK